MKANVRALAAKCCFAVVEKGRSLADELPNQQQKAEDKDRALLQELVYGVLRYLPELEFISKAFIDKPLKGKQRVTHFLILVGIYQLKHTRIPDHATLSETVAACKSIKQFHLKGMINGVLRNIQRQGFEQLQDIPDPVKYNHPSWLINKLKSGYPDHWPDILKHNMCRPPMWLRVNQQKQNINDYLNKLSEQKIDVEAQDAFSGAIKLTSPIDVTKLPLFEQGHVSVQDGAAQQAAKLLDCQPNDHVLDCCAAPGGKTCHILELTPDITMTAIDVDPKRLTRIEDNLARLSLNAKLVSGDAATANTWWDGQQYDRILLDAPCSGTGVIRRHPDIKWLRKASDIETLVILQQQILKNVWSLLKPGGTLLYATCSILPEENCKQIQRFIKDNSNAELVTIEPKEQAVGWQILPNNQGMDGFYYAKLKKNNNK